MRSPRGAGRGQRADARNIGAEQSLDVGTVVALKRNGGVDAESTRALQGEYTDGVGFIEEVVGAEVAKRATLDEVLELEPVMGLT